jgi:hypothetical protein
MDATFFAECGIIRISQDQFAFLPIEESLWSRFWEIAANHHCNPESPDFLSRLQLAETEYQRACKSQTD